MFQRFLKKCRNRRAARKLTNVYSYLVDTYKPDYVTLLAIDVVYTALVDVDQEYYSI